MSAVLPEAANGCMTAKGQQLKDDTVILYVERTPVRIGAYSPFGQLRGPLRQALVNCRSSHAVSDLDREELGIFSVRTSRAISALTAYPGFEQLKAPREAARGALTPNLWSALLRDAPMPSLDDKIDAMTLTFEATDFGQKPDWNFCKDSADPLAIANSPVDKARAPGPNFAPWDIARALAA